MLISKLSKSNSSIDNCQLTIVDWRFLIRNQSEPHYLNRQSTIYNSQWNWWRWTDSNRWPPACKAGALPAELHPLKFKPETRNKTDHFGFRNSGFGFHRVSGRWWAWMELNHRPHAYQACALTELSYRPIRMRNYEFGFRNSIWLRTPNPRVPNSVRPSFH